MKWGMYYLSTEPAIKFGAFIQEYNLIKLYYDRAMHHDYGIRIILLTLLLQYTAAMFMVKQQHHAAILF